MIGGYKIFKNLMIINGLIQLGLGLRLGLRLGLGLRLIFYVEFVYAKRTALASCITVMSQVVYKFSNFKIHSRVGVSNP